MYSLTFILYVAKLLFDSNVFLCHFVAHKLSWQPLILNNNNNTLFQTMVHMGKQ